jgi:hypothetical protein
MYTSETVESSSNEQVHVLLVGAAVTGRVRSSVSLDFEILRCWDGGEVDNPPINESPVRD